METTGTNDGKQTDQVGCKPSSLVLARVRRLESGQETRQFCRCGLSLPCNSCLTDAKSFVNSPGEITIGQIVSELNRRMGLIAHGSDRQIQEVNKKRGNKRTSSGGQAVPVTDAASGRCSSFA